METATVLLFCVITSGATCISNEFAGPVACQQAGENLSKMVELGYMNRAWWACIAADGTVASSKARP